jgi:hypothetical protein
MGINRVMMLMSYGLLILLAMAVSAGGAWIHRSGQGTAMAAPADLTAPVVARFAVTRTALEENPDTDTDLQNDTEDLDTGMKNDTGDVDTGMKDDTGDVDQSMKNDTGDVDQSMKNDTGDVDQSMKNDTEDIDTDLEETQ